MPSNRWEPWELKFLEKHADSMARAEIASHLGRTKAAVKAKMAKMELLGGAVDHWTEEEDQIIRDLYPTTPTNEMRLHGRNVDQIRTRASRLGVVKELRQGWKWRTKSE